MDSHSYKIPKCGVEVGLEAKIKVNILTYVSQRKERNLGIKSLEGNYL